VNIFHSINEFVSVGRPVVTIGVFDGVHRGHREIIQILLATAREKGCASVVVTFHPHPRLVVGNPAEVKLLQSIDEKIERFRSLGIDTLLIIPFDQEFSQMKPADFIQTVVVDSLHACTIITGHDHLFGHDRAGDFKLLVESGIRNDFLVIQVDAIQHCNQTISSSAIRDALLSGNVSLANCLLGYTYFLRGKVIRGNQIGNRIGFPTANIRAHDPYKLIPSIGVYATFVKWNGNIYRGMCNIGMRPTIDANRLTVEVNIFDFKEDIYNEIITLYFVERIRDEKKFTGLEQLKEQLNRDKESARKLLETESLSL
jgi:riboflavin kinase/FMN adenylyltransferase